MWQKLALGMDDRSIASKLCVDLFTVYRTVKQFNECGSVSKKAYPKDCREKKLTKTVEMIIKTHDSGSCGQVGRARDKCVLYRNQVNAVFTHL